VSGPSAGAYSARVETEAGGRVLRYSPAVDGQPLAVGDALSLLALERAFRAWFRARLAAAPFPAYYWETPAQTSATLNRPWEFALIDAPALRGVPPDPQAFAEHFRPATRAVSFPNLGGDAWLVAPCPNAGADACAHLADFTRGADEAAQDELWRLVGETVAGRLGTTPRWLSTSGTGVYWLHVRLDSSPKYYTYPPYREAPR
jgi:hypothetical protein